jgi:hypothetical protein
MRRVGERRQDGRLVQEAGKMKSWLTMSKPKGSVTKSPIPVLGEDGDGVVGDDADVARLLDCQRGDERGEGGARRTWTMVKNLMLNLELGTETIDIMRNLILVLF